jgi:hypothetical protein
MFLFFFPFFLFSSFVYYELYRERNEKEKKQTKRNSFILLAIHLLICLFSITIFFFPFFSSMNIVIFLYAFITCGCSIG